MAATRSTSTGWQQDGGGVTRSTSTGWSQQEAEAASGKSIVSVVPAMIEDGETGVLITVSNITTSGAAVHIDGVAQTVTGTTADTITFTAERSTLSLGNAYLRVVEA